jgi:hypothetical protein
MRDIRCIYCGSRMRREMRYRGYVKATCSSCLFSGYLVPINRRGSVQLVFCKVLKKSTKVILLLLVA